jgi:hypothetical protein
MHDKLCGKFLRIGHQFNDVHMTLLHYAIFHIDFERLISCH